MWEWVKDAGSLVSTLLSGAFLFVAWLWKRSVPSRQEIEALREEMAEVKNKADSGDDELEESLGAKHGELERRLAHLESKMKVVPSKDDLHELTRELDSLGTAVTAVREKVEGVGAGMSRIENQVGMLYEHALKQQRGSQ